MSGLLRTEARPLVFAAGRETAFELSAGAPGFAPGAAHLVRFLPLERTLEPNDRGGAAYPSAEATADAQGALRLRYAFPSEGPYLLRIFRAEDPTTLLAEPTVYALDADLAALRPFRCDFHAHSDRSDGREPPAILAARYRAAGFDAFALTDHGQRAPSVEAEAAVAATPSGLVVLRGEEVHPPDNHLHIVQVGGEPGCNLVFEREPARYATETAALRRAGCLQGLPEGIDPAEWASCLWCAREIARQGGISIFPHPYWRSDLLHAPLAVALHLLREGVFDAFEVLGGNEPDENHLQTALYHEVRAEGRPVNAVGSSDSHGAGPDARWFDWYSTFVLAPPAGPGAARPEAPTPEGIRDAVKRGLSVALETRPGEPPRAFGPLRLVRYAMFLLAEYLPAYRAACREEGLLLERLLGGDASAREPLARAAAETARFRDRIFEGGHASWSN